MVYIVTDIASIYTIFTESRARFSRGISLPKKEREGKNPINFIVLTFQK
jgi:hypothetical protein